MFISISKGRVYGVDTCIYAALLGYIKRFCV